MLSNKKELSYKPEIDDGQCAGSVNLIIALPDYRTRWPKGSEVLE